MKNRSGLIIALAVAVVVVAAVVLYPRLRAEKPAEVADLATQATTPATSVPGVATSPPTTEPTPSAKPPAAPAAVAPTPPAEEEDPTKITFKADAKGRMVTDQNARLNLEKLNALYTPAERQKMLEQLSATLPPAAARDLNDMMERYVNYDVAMRQTFPPGQDLASPEEGLNLVDSMHNLRVQYFGADAADGFYAKEEKIQRELLRLMSLEKDQSMTIEEKAERAQAMYKSQMPETMAEVAAGRKLDEARAQRKKAEAAQRKQN